jgi:hypothetical protein
LSALTKELVSYTKELVSFTTELVSFTTELVILNAVKNLLPASVGMIATPSEQQVLPVGQDDKVEEVKEPLIKSLL